MMTYLKTLWLAFLAWLKTAGDPTTLPDPQTPPDSTPSESPTPVPIPEQPTNHLEDFLLAIARFEGFYVAGTVPQRCNNPGDLRWPYGEPWPYKGVIGVTPRKFLIFSTADAGFAALRTYVTNVCLGKSSLYTKEAKERGRAGSADMTILEFFDVYAPSSDNNPTEKYAAYVATACGLTSQSRMREVYS